MAQVQEWIEVCTLDDLEEEGVFGVEVGGMPIAVYEVEGDVYATHDICTHGLARLSEGYLENGLIECPLHQGLFDVKTGAPAGAPCTEAVRTFPAKLDGNTVLVAFEKE